MKNKRRYTLFSLLFVVLVALTVLVMSHLTAPWDLHIDQSLYAMRHSSVTYLFTLITWLGNPIFVIVFAALTFLILWISHYRKYVGGLLITLGGAALSDYLLKIIIARPRPLAPLPVSIDHSFSYPSGHATASMALYGYLLFLAWRLLPAGWQKILATLLLSLIILAVGFSRLYLGMHFPTDILGGYLLSALWLVIGTSLYTKTKPRY